MLRMSDTGERTKRRFNNYLDGIMHLIELESE